MHIGQMRTQWYDAVNAKDANEGMKWWRNADVTSEASMSSLGAKNAFKLSKSPNDLRKLSFHLCLPPNLIVMFLSVSCSCAKYSSFSIEYNVLTKPSGW